MTIFVTGLALELPSRTLETFYMFGVTTLWTSISSFVCWLGSTFLKGGLWFLCSLENLFWLFDLCLWEYRFHLDLHGGRPVLSCLKRFTWATWGSVATDLMCLAVDFDDSIFLASCLTLLAGNFSRSIFTIIDCLRDKLFIFQRKTEYISMQNTCCFCWVLGKRHLSLNCFVPITDRSFSLSKACQQVKSSSSFICLWLAKIFILGPYNFQA